MAKNWRNLVKFDLTRQVRNFRTPLYVRKFPLIIMQFTEDFLIIRNFPGKSGFFSIEFSKFPNGKFKIFGNFYFSLKF